MLQDKSMHELRLIASSYDIADVFSKSQTQLIDAIRLKQAGDIEGLRPPPPPKPEYDARLMTQRPSNYVTKEEVLALLQPLISVHGLHITFPEPERWHMSCGKKEDSGSMRMPLRVIYGCAAKVVS